MINCNLVVPQIWRSSLFILFMLNAFSRASRSQTSAARQILKFASFSSGSRDDLPLNDRWTAMAAKELKGKDVRSTLIHETNEQMLIKPIYTSEDWQPSSDKTELPGEYPYKRGPYATMFTHRPWTIRQYAGFSTVEDSNRFYKANLAAG